MKTLLLIPFLFVCSLVIGQSSKIIGTPIKIGNLEVAQNDLPKMNWSEAKKACANLGNGWRLPTKDELILMYKNKGKIRGFVFNAYWSSSEDDNGDVWVHSFNNGGMDDPQRLGMNNDGNVRAVRSL